MNIIYYTSISGYIRNLFKDTWNKLAVTIEGGRSRTHILFM